MRLFLRESRGKEVRGEPKPSRPGLWLGGSKLHQHITGIPSARQRRGMPLLLIDMFSCRDSGDESYCNVVYAAQAALVVTGAVLPVAVKRITPSLLEQKPRTPVVFKAAGMPPMV
jgi:hypothetical protein